MPDDYEVEIYNPNEKPVEELPVIYGFNNGSCGPVWDAVLLAQDGTPLGGHVCSHECFMARDLGVVKGFRPDHHERFRKHYPGGYKMEFVGYDEFKNHEGLALAVTLIDQDA